MGIFKKKIKNFIRFLKQKELVPVATPIDSNKLLERKIAFITGGSSGIGYAIANEFIKNGCKVVLGGRNESRLNECLEKLENSYGGGTVHALAIDVTDIPALPGKVEEALNLFEEHRIDILVNSAGLVSHSDFFNMTEEEYDSIMDTNVKGTYFLSRCVGNNMIENGIKGHILNITSSSALRPGWTPYQLSKWAVRGFTIGLAELMQPYGIVVNAIAPGPTATPMLGQKEGDTLYCEDFPLKRYEMPEEIAALAVYLASPLGNVVVGDTMYATGGSGILDLHH